MIEELCLNCEDADHQYNSTESSEEDQKSLGAKHTVKSS